MRLLIGLLLLLGSLDAQTATLRGVVSDQSGAVVPAATVVLMTKLPARDIASLA